MFILKLSVKKIVEICDASLYCGSEEVICSSFVKDTRILKEGDTYIGIKGENYNGNDFYIDAFNKGVNCAILEKKYFKENDEYKNKPIILVEDSIKALKQLATYVRNNLNTFIVGVTGSVGKTSTRDMIYSVLNENFKTLKTENNYNNEIGLPLTLLKLTDEEMAVIEMGMNHIGEIDYLSNITKPNISVITNVGTAHIGELGSRENILKAKLEITNGMDEKGILIINNDNDLLHEYYLKNKNNIITIGINNESDFQAFDIKENDSSSTFKIKHKDTFYEITCSIPGKAYIYNALIAFAVGFILDIDYAKIANGIKNIKLTENRMEIIKLKKGIKLINGVYNASYDSMKSSLEILKSQSGERKIAVLGTMLELGSFSKELHENVGSLIINNDVDYLITVGSDAKYIGSKAVSLGFNEERVFSFENNNDATELLKRLIKDNDTILLKASNGLHFKEIVDNLVSYIGLVERDN